MAKSAIIKREVMRYFALNIIISRRGGGMREAPEMRMATARPSICGWACFVSLSADENNGRSAAWHRRSIGSVPASPALIVLPGSKNQLLLAQARAPKCKEACSGYAHRPEAAPWQRNRKKYGMSRTFAHHGPKRESQKSWRGWLARRRRRTREGESSAGVHVYGERRRKRRASYGRWPGKRGEMTGWPVPVKSITVASSATPFFGVAIFCNMA